MNPFTFLIGLSFGFLIVAARLSDYTVIHDMLLFREPDVFLLMGSSFVVAMPCCGCSGADVGRRP